jgi:hypothetical protein
MMGTACPVFFAIASHWWGKAFGARIWVSVALLLTAVVLAGMGNLYPPAGFAAVSLRARDGLAPASG